MSKFFDQLENLSKEERDQILSGLLAAQSLIRFIEQDGFNIPDEIAAQIAIFSNEEFKTFARSLHYWIFEGAVIHANEGDSTPWHWISSQNALVVKSVLCWLIHRAKGAIAS